MASIIIIGAGIAGLAAALELAQRGHQITLLEARARLGGRIYTAMGADQLTPIELGASFWEGRPDNPFYQHYFSHCAQEPHPVSTQLVALTDSQVFLLKPDGITQTQNIQPLAKAYQQAQLYLKDLPQLAVGKTCQEYLNELFPLPLTPQAELYWVKKWIEHDLRHHCTPLSFRGFGSFNIPPDFSNLEAWNEEAASFCFVKGGYHQIIEQITNECQAIGVKILLNQQVLQIDDRYHQGVKVKTITQELKADKVISTIPVGVLKKSATTLFASGLCAEKHQAIQYLGIHEATRIIFEFAQPFWEALNPYLFITTGQTPGFKEFRINFPLHGKAILQTDSYADVATTILNKKNDQKAHQLLIHYVMQDLRKIYPTAPYPIYYVIQHWTNDPFAQGAYPYRTTLMTEAVQQALERPEGNIFFAGGDFSRYGFSVHNAYANGKKVAHLI